ncbi:signal peptidase I [Desmospora activa]|uniref:Signal peptidase I n=1 Tax=Desmospora activa DSM 45169 TaxID=1121389 RepID=A0A2T4Z1Y2_9BACL|nr:signal peptidase I [Desmospora activa]PTM54784.1 signal peptidase I [Desmospora activa DSM 45169]
MLIQNRRKALYISSLLFVSILLIVLLFFRFYQLFTIEGDSMSPALQDGQAYWVERGPMEPRRGDIVIFYNQEDDFNHVKRVVALADERIQIKESRVLVNGKPLDEPYLASDATTTDFGPVTVPQGEVFVLGDNREQSLDSRQLGTVSIMDIRGRMLNPER